MNPAAVLTSDATIAVVGAGRLGTVLARALRATEFDVRGPSGRTDEIPQSDIALLCVPDAAIPEAAARTRPHVTLLGHVSGATPLTDVDFSIHPLQTFTGTESPEVFHGIGAAIDGRTPIAREAAEHLARAVGARPFPVDDAHRASYHAAASFASNFVLTVLDAAEHLAESAGVSDARDLLAPLVRQSVDNWRERGASEALTGPIARGDIATVERQREAAEREGLDVLFDALANATGVVARGERVSTRSLRSLAQRTEKGRSLAHGAENPAAGTSGGDA
ncbi:DUF2520 domain-containing protein [Microbacterium sp. M28]|uniref:Rossmann-like and DUF2520 domain-containing protein n=1 Tax=Microbacterium sp. M28 TaxID=2962064 RepID=UPI0021F4B933|nr:DUF2520 domain-containing protein [Microbacterium sp. M28]UYO96880.1 DUF2520 domain-containing protein [Microbacterium sp. M28]